jgi:hypothetical protein
MLLIHSWLRWVFLILLIIVIIKSWMGWKNKIVYTPQDKLFNLILMILADTQLLLGLALYFMSDMMKGIRTVPMGEVMKNGVLRFWMVEHITAMLISIALIHVGKVIAQKKESDSAKFKAQFIWFTIALVLILFSIPWPFREAGRAWFSFG